MSGACSVCGVAVKILRRGMCNTHYRRKMKYGDPHKLINRPQGSGTPHIDGYWMFEIEGRPVLRHILVAEKAIGRRLPKGAHVHHVDYDRSNDANNNLVICPNASYHALLHIRTDALNICGNANWRKCGICKVYDDPENLIFQKPGGNIMHRECRRERDRNRRSA